VNLGGDALLTHVFEVVDVGPEGGGEIREHLVVHIVLLAHLTDDRSDGGVVVLVVVVEEAAVVAVVVVAVVVVRHERKNIKETTVSSQLMSNPLSPTRLLYKTTCIIITLTWEMVGKRWCVTW